MTTPEIIFSEWYPWDQVKDIPEGHRPGLYIIGCFDTKPEGSAQPDVREVLYIGETHGPSQNIRKRLQKFFQAAQVGQMIHKHSGGNRFNRLLFCGHLLNIYAAGYAPLVEDERLLTPFIYYAERKLILDYVLKWGTIPQCNGR